MVFFPELIFSLLMSMNNFSSLNLKIFIDLSINSIIQYLKSTDHARKHYYFCLNACKNICFALNQPIHDVYFFKDDGMNIRINEILFSRKCFLFRYHCRSCNTSCNMTPKEFSNI